MASLILHGAVLGCMLFFWTHHMVSAVPIFQSGEFSLEITGGQAATGIAAEQASAPPLARPPPEMEAEPEEETEAEKEEAPFEEAPEIMDPFPEEKILAEEMQIEPTPMPPIAMLPAPSPKPPPKPATPITKPVPTTIATRSASRSAPSTTNTNAGTPRQAGGTTNPIAGTASPGLPGKPGLASHIHPVYPSGARLRGEEGRVTVRANVTVSGQAQTAEVIRSSGYPDLDQAALNAVRRARFIPARKGWTPVASETVLTFRFSLVD